MKGFSKPQRFTAATWVVWFLELMAFWMNSFDGYIGAPPAMMVLSAEFDICAGAGTSVRARGIAVGASIAERFHRVLVFLGTRVRTFDE